MKTIYYFILFKFASAKVQSFHTSLQIFITLCKKNTIILDKSQHNTYSYVMNTVRERAA